MIAYQLGEETRHAKSGWHEVTTEEFIGLADLPLEEKAAKLAGLTIEEAERTQGLEVIWRHCLELASSEPEGEWPGFVPADFGKDAIGRIELCLKFIEQVKGEALSVAHYLYAAYAYQSEYNLLDCFVGSFPGQLANRAKALPVTQTYTPIVKILEGVLQVKTRPLYVQTLQKEIDAKQQNSGIERFEKYGFFATLSAVANGDILRLPQLLETPADVFYHWLCLETERSDYQEEYLRQSQPNAIR
jgi:hypothetical protein